jgi:hypothetical protein
VKVSTQLYTEAGKLKMEDNLIFFCKWKTTSIFLKMEDDIISAGANGSPRSCVCKRLTLRSAPHRHQRNLFGARVWGGEGQTNLKYF